MSINLLAIGALLAGTILIVDLDQDSDRAEVRRAVLDYVEALEQGKPENIERSVSKDLAKFGFSRGEETSTWKHHPMTFDQLVELATEMKAKGYVPENPKHEVTLLDVMDKTASAKLSAFWGIDYMHLVKYDGKWKIVHVLWQSHPLGRDDVSRAHGERGDN